MQMNVIDKVSYTLVVIGGLNLGLIGFFNYSLIDRIFSYNIARFIYAVMGLGALWLLYKMLVMMKVMKPINTSVSK